MNSIAAADPYLPTIFTPLAPIKVLYPLMLLFLGLYNVIKVERLLSVDNRCRC